MPSNQRCAECDEELVPMFAKIDEVAAVCGQRSRDCSDSLHDFARRVHTSMQPEQRPVGVGREQERQQAQPVSSTD
jgi:hypothetical protein